MAPQRWALNIGLNRVDRDFYQFQHWDSDLLGCENDATDLARLAADARFDVVADPLLSDRATREAVTREIARAAHELRGGDLFLLTLAGHGLSRLDENGDEDDGRDEAWCLFDQWLLDDDVYRQLAGFAPGVRVLVLLDTCHSGSGVTFAPAFGAARMRAVPPVRTRPRGGPRRREPPASRFRLMPEEMVERVYAANRAAIDAILTTSTVRARDVPPSVILIAACHDRQLAEDGAENGVFTGVVRRVWDEGRFSGDHVAFHKAIVAATPNLALHTPRLSFAGTEDPGFVGMRPFTV